MAVKEPIDLNSVTANLSSLEAIASQMYERGKNSKLGEYVNQLKKTLNTQMGTPSPTIDVQAAKVSVSTASMFKTNGKDQASTSNADNSEERKGPSM